LLLAKRTWNTKAVEQEEEEEEEEEL